MNSSKEDTLPSLQEADELLVWAHAQNPGPWMQHSRTAAKVAGEIASHCGMDKNTAYILGLLHDIGRYNGITGIRHTYYGNILMKEKGYISAARICLTHSFIQKDLRTYQGLFDCTEEEENYIKDELNKMEYDDYDKLIQLCDHLSLPEGACILEKRLIDVTRRNGLYPAIREKWDLCFQLKDYFDEKCNENIYTYFSREITKTCIG